MNAVVVAALGGLVAPLAMAGVSVHLRLLGRKKRPRTLALVALALYGASFVVFALAVVGAFLSA